MGKFTVNGNGFVRSPEGILSYGIFGRRNDGKVFRGELRLGEHRSASTAIQSHTPFCAERAGPNSMIHHDAMKTSKQHTVHDDCRICPTNGVLLPLSQAACSCGIARCLIVRSVRRSCPTWLVSCENKALSWTVAVLQWIPSSAWFPPNFLTLVSFSLMFFQGFIPELHILQERFPAKTQSADRGCGWWDAHRTWISLGVLRPAASAFRWCPASLLLPPLARAFAFRCQPAARHPPGRSVGLPPGQPRSAAAEGLLGPVSGLGYGRRSSGGTAEEFAPVLVGSRSWLVVWNFFGFHSVGNFMIPTDL